MNRRMSVDFRKRTRWQTLPQLLSLLRIVKGKGVEVTVAPDFELGLCLATGYPGRNLLYPRLCKYNVVYSWREWM